MYNIHSISTRIDKDGYCSDEVMMIRREKTTTTRKDEDKDNYFGDEVMMMISSSIGRRIGTYIACWTL